MGESKVSIVVHLKCIDVILFCSSQQPDLILLQQRLHQQLHENREEIPSKSSQSVEAQVVELRNVCKTRKILVVLDDM